MVSGFGLATAVVALTASRLCPSLEAAVSRTSCTRPRGVPAEGVTSILIVVEAPAASSGPPVPASMSGFSTIPPVGAL